MKNTLLFFFSLLMLTCILFLTGSSNAFHASYTFSSLSAVPEAWKANASPNANGRARDLKIPDAGAREAVSYNYRDNFGNAGPDTGKNISGSGPQPGNRLVVIDAGHGGGDPGTKDNGVVEKEVVLDIARRLDSALRLTGISTHMIRTDDRYIDHKERIESANEKNAALYISIHCDWYKDTSYSGTSTLYYPSKTLYLGGLQEIDYATVIQSELIKALKTKDRGINDRTDLAVLRRAKMPSVLVELGFLSNKSDAALLASEETRQTAAEALAEGIKKALARVDAK